MNALYHTSFCYRRDGKSGSLFWFTFPYRSDNTAQLSLSKTQSPVSSHRNSFSFVPNYLTSAVSNALESPTSFSTMGGDSLPPSAFPSPQHVSASSFVEKPSPDHHSKKILLVDDTPTIIKVVGRLLQSNGHVVDTAINGHQGLEKLKRSYLLKDTTTSTIDNSTGINTQYAGYDLVLSDLQVHCPLHTSFRPSLPASLPPSLPSSSDS